MGADAARRWRQNHPEAVKEQKKLYYERHREELIKRRTPRNIARAHALRSKVLTTLGGCCVRCSFNDFRALQIDHINGGGNQERLQIKSRDVFYKKVLENSEGYQLLCANCNCIKRHENKEHRSKRLTITKD